MSEQLPANPAIPQVPVPSASFGLRRMLLVLVLSLVSGIPYILLFVFLPIHERAIPYAAAGIALAATALIMSKQPMAALGRGEPIIGSLFLQVGRILAILSLMAGGGLFFVGGEFGCAREKARSANCLSNMKQLSLAAFLYAEDHHDRLPDANRWVTELLPYTRNNRLLFKCGKDESKAASSYGMNTALSGMKLGDVTQPSETILFYETAHPGINPHGGIKDIINRHNGGSDFGYCDGHAKWNRKIRPLMFDPKWDGIIRH